MSYVKWTLKKDGLTEKKVDLTHVLPDEMDMEMSPLHIYGTWVCHRSL